MTLPTSGEYRSDIDGLRAIAVVAVVLYHAEIGLFPGGFVGVDIFFVISGFLITRIIERRFREGGFSLIGFYERRARRIFPALIAVIVFALAVGTLLYLPHDLASLAMSALSALLFASNIYFWREQNDYFGAEPNAMPLLHTWSLGVEEQFYIAFPVLLFVAHRYLARRVAPLMLAATLGSFVLSAYLVEARPSVAFYMLPSRFWELGIGACCAIEEERLRKLVEPVLIPVSWLALLLLTVPIFAYDDRTGFPGLAALPVCAGAALLILTGKSDKRPLPNAMLSLPAIVLIGLASYSIYLWHWPILTLVGYLPWPAGGERLAMVIAVLAVFPIGYLSYRFIEAPFRNRQSFSKRAIWSLSGAAFAIVGALAVAIVAAGGLPQRIRGQDREAILAASAEEYRSDCTQFSSDNTSASCQIGAASEEPSFLLLGDSHARMFSWAVEDAAKRAGVSGLHITASACPPLLSIESNSPCGAHRQQLYDFLDANPQIDTVILSAYWLSYFEDDNLLYGNTIPVRGFDQDDYIALYRDSIEHLAASGRTIFVLEDAPRLARSLPQAATLSGLLGVELETGISRLQYDEDNALASAMMHAASVRDYTIVSTADQMCGENCVARSEDELYYWDDSHLTRKASLRFFADHFYREIFAP